MQTLAAHQKYKANFDNPDDQNHFSRSIKNLREGLPKQQNLLPAEIFRDRLADISIDTNTFIVVSETNEYACNIWGEPNDISRAKAALRALELSLTQPSKGEKAWIKQGAYDGRVVHRDIVDTWQNVQREHFQRDTDLNTLAYQAHLYWPDGYDLEKFLDYYCDDVLKELMTKYTCIIRQNPAERVIKIGCDTQQVLFQVHNRLIGLTREMVAKQKPGLYATHCEVPSLAAYRDKVKLINTLTSAGRVNIPTLTGKTLPNSEYENWTQLSSSINKRYRLAAKNALRSCISSLHTSRKHLQLRINFGNFGLLQVMKADSGSDTYQIDEFLHKIQKPGTKVVQCPLEEGQSFHFIDNIESVQDLQPLDISWEVHFDFSSGTSKRLQLVKEYIPNFIDPDEPSVAATRWLTFDDTAIDDNSEILSVNHIDMEKCGYNLHLGGGTIFQSQRTSNANDAFEKTIRFRPSMNGLRYDSNKHVIHPYGNPELTTIREVTIAKYQYKDTRSTFEVRRTDTFNARSGESSPIAERTEWTAAYYYAGWDSLLSDFANIDPGQDVEWKRNLETFFPKIEDEDNPRVLPHGFKTFMKEVDQLQTLISKAIKPNNTTHNNNNTNGITTNGASK